MCNRFIQKTKIKKGALRQQLDIPAKKTIPKTFLKKITKARVSSTIRNPTDIGKKKVKVTKLLKRRAVLARTLGQLRDR